MELRNINTFLHIAELHSFSRTARQLGYSQSAVSSQIAQLEAELGAPLFDRVGKTVRLTDAGQTFLGYARTLLATAQQAQAALQPARQISGSLRIALADSVCSTFLPGLLKRYHALCPQVELVLCTATADGMLQMLGTNQITEINCLRTFLIFCYMNGMLYQFINSFILCRRNRDDRDSQHILHLIDQNGTAVFPHLIHHIQRKNHRNIQFHQLHRQIQISLNIRRIYNVDDSFWMFIKHKISCYDFLAGIR